MAPVNRNSYLSAYMLKCDVLKFEEPLNHENTKRK
jgi:hypothetical protein